MKLMLFNGGRTIDVTEYTNTSVTTKGMHLINAQTQCSDFSFNGWELADAMARTVCSRHIDKPEYWADFISSLLELTCLIHNTRPNARISSSRIERLRDFSRTGRIGEIAQGLTFLNLRKSEGYKFISDFEFFCLLNNIDIPAQTATPDFIAQKASNNDLCLAESKGIQTSATSSVKSALAKAMSQCVSGENIIQKHGGFNVTKKLGYCFELSDENAYQDSKMHFVDPIHPSQERYERYELIRIHYATWFYMIGDFPNAQNLLQRGMISFNKRYYKSIEIDGEPYWILHRFPHSLRRFIDNELPFFNFRHYRDDYLFGNWTVGISSTIIDMLTENFLDIINEINFKNKSSEGYELFSDGTMLLKQINR